MYSPYEFGLLVEALVVDRDLALERHVVERRHPGLADDREAALLVRVQPREVQVRGEPGREAQEAEDDVLDALAHVALAARLDLVRLLAGEPQQHRHVVGAERPQRVLVGAQLAEVQAVAVDVEHAPELAVVDQLLELHDAGVVLEQVADHQRRGPRPRAAATTASASADRLRHRLLDEAVLAGLSTRDRQRGVGRHRRGQGDRVDAVVGEHLVEVGGEARAREHAARRARGWLRRRRSTTRARRPAAPRSCGRCSVPSSPGRRRRRAVGVRSSCRAESSCAVHTLSSGA